MMTPYPEFDEEDIGPDPADPAHGFTTADRRLDISHEPAGADLAADVERSAIIAEGSGKLRPPVALPERHGGTPRQETPRADMRAAPSAPGRMLRAALRYAAKGWHVLPLHAPLPARDRAAPLRCSCGRNGCPDAGKHPRISGGVSMASADPAQIQAWWKRWLSANIGISLGPSGLWALDVDPRAGGDQALIALIRDHGSIGDTAHVLTGSGGDHFYYLAPSVEAGVDGALDASPAGSMRLRGKLAPGLDVKAHGGYLVSPPSVHASGARYMWTGPRRPPLPAPPWLLSLAAAPTRATGPGPTKATTRATRPLRRPDVTERARAYLRALPPAVQGNGGNAATYQAALALVRGFDLAPDVAIELLLADYNPRCEPPWTAAELAQKVESAAVSPLPSGYLLNDRKPR